MATDRDPAHTSNAPIGFTPHEASAWSVGYEEGRRAALAAPPVVQQAAQVISVEDSLRTLLRWERERVEALEDELRDLRSKLPGATERDAAFMGLLTARPAQPAPQAGAAEVVQMWHDRVKAEYPGSEAEYWPSSVKAQYMEAEILELRVALKAAHPTDQPSQDAERWQFVLEHAVSGKAPKDKGFDITYVPVGHNGSEWGRIEIEWRGAKWEHITADGVNAIIDAARAAQAQGESKGGTT